MSTSSITARRSLHLVDLENLVGDPCATGPIVRHIFDRYLALALAPPELVVRRYGRLVVGSGDGIFVARAARAHDLGVDVLVVSRPESCSWRLRTLTHRFLSGTDYGLAA